MSLEIVRANIAREGLAHVYRESPWVPGKRSESAYIEQVTEDRVIGFEFHAKKPGYRRYFNVKHDGKMFKMSGPCGGTPHYFKHVDAVIVPYLYDLVQTSNWKHGAGGTSETITYYGLDLNIAEAFDVIKSLGNQRGICVTAPGYYPRKSITKTVRPGWKNKYKVIYKLQE